MVSHLLILVHFVGFFILQQISAHNIGIKGELYEQSIFTLQSKEDVEFCLECKRKTYIAYSLIQHDDAKSVKRTLQMNASKELPICKRPTFQVDKLRTFVSDSDRLNLKKKPIDSSVANKLWGAFITIVRDLPYDRIVLFPGQVINYFSQPSKQDASKFCLECSKVERLIYVNKDKAGGECFLKDYLVAFYLSSYQASNMCPLYPRTKTSMNTASPSMSITCDKYNKYQSRERLHKNVVSTVCAGINHMDVQKQATQGQEDSFALEDTVVAPKLWKLKEAFSTVMPEIPTKKDRLVENKRQIWVSKTFSAYHVWIWDALKQCERDIPKACRSPTSNILYRTKDFAKHSNSFLLPAFNHQYLKIDEKTWNKGAKRLVWCFDVASAKDHCRSVHLFWWLFEVFNRNRGCCKSGKPCWLSSSTSDKTLANDQNKAKRFYGNQHFVKQYVTFMYLMLNRIDPKDRCRTLTTPYNSKPHSTADRKHEYKDEDRSLRTQSVNSNGQGYCFVDATFIRNLSCNWPTVTSTKTTMQYVCLSLYVHMFEVHQRCRGCSLSGKSRHPILCSQSKSLLPFVDNHGNRYMELHHPFLLNHSTHPRSPQLHLSWSFSPYDALFDNRYSMMWWVWCFEALSKYHGCCRYGGFCLFRSEQVLMPNKINKTLDNRKPVTYGPLSSKLFSPKTSSKVHYQQNQKLSNGVKKRQPFLPSLLLLWTKSSSKRTYFMKSKFWIKEAQHSTSANVKSIASSISSNNGIFAVTASLFKETSGLASKLVTKWSERPYQNSYIVNISIWRWHWLFEVYGKQRGCHKMGGSIWLRCRDMGAVSIQRMETGVKEVPDNATKASTIDLKVRGSTLNESYFQSHSRGLTCAKQNMLQAMLQPKISLHWRSIKTMNQSVFHSIILGYHENRTKGFDTTTSFDMFSTKIQQAATIQYKLINTVSSSQVSYVNQVLLQSFHVQEHYNSEPSQVLPKYTTISPLEYISQVSHLPPSKIILLQKYKERLFDHVSPMESLAISAKPNVPMRKSASLLRSCNSMLYINWCFKRLNHVQPMCSFQKKKKLLTAEVTESDVWVLLLEVISILNLIGGLVKGWSGSRSSHGISVGLKDDREPSEEDEMRDEDIGDNDKIVAASITVDAVDENQVLAPSEPPLLEIETIGAIVNIPRSLTAGYLCDIRFPQREYPDLRF